MYFSSDEEEALLLLALEDEISRFVFLSDRCRSYIIFFPRDMQKNSPPQEKEKEVIIILIIIFIYCSWVVTRWQWSMKSI